MPSSTRPQASDFGNGHVPARRAVNWFDAGAIGTVAATFLLLAIAFVWPWLPQLFPSRAAHQRYLPLTHGQATTRVTLDANRVPVSWTSDNLISIPAWQTFDSHFPELVTSQLLSLIPELGTAGEFPADVRLFRSHSRTLLADGSVVESETFILRQPERDQILAVNLAGIDFPLLYAPPLDVTVGDHAPSTSHQQGTFAGIYTYTAQINQHPIQHPTTTVSSPFGAWADCQKVQSTVRINTADTILLEETSTLDYCANTGVVAQTTHHPDGTSSNSYLLHDLASSLHANVAALLPPPQTIKSAPWIAPNLKVWQLDEHAALATTRTTANTIAPTYVAANHPFVLVATRDGPLIALDAHQPNTRLWDFHTTGSIHSQPTIDPATGIIYVGSSDKHLYAITSDGLFLWRFPTVDNVTAKPLIVQEFVVVVSEDGTLVALDRLTGALRWQRTFATLSIASPAYLATTTHDLIIVGNDEGTLRAVDAASGTTVWETELDGGNRVPLVVADDTIYTSSTAGTLQAIAPDGTTQWHAETLTPPQGAPTLAGDQVVVVDTQGWLYAFSLPEGALLWRSRAPDYVGQPLFLKEAQLLIVATINGSVSALSLQGETLQQWQLPASMPADNAFRAHAAFGPTLGGGAIWLGDTGSRVLRLGPPIAAHQESSP